MHNSNLTYRADIDGLRAIAILAVVMYHAFPSQLPGGFIGVDIFFVISGFLISSIIFKSLQKGKFNFAEFYARRISRLFPALIIVMTIFYGAGWFLLFPVEFKQLSKHIVASAGFIQNVILNNEAGYFDTSSELKPLLHLWSLSIEEQFYLVFPLLIWIIWRFGLPVLSVVLILLALMSFGINMTVIEKDASLAFFMPHTRCWELLAGSLLALSPFLKTAPWVSTLFQFLPNLRKFPDSPTPGCRATAPSDIFAIFGMLLVVTAFWSLDHNKIYPGAWALFPVLGTCLLIFAGPTAWLNRNILTSRLIIFVGLISYPLYLWHWPLLSFVRIVTGETPSYATRIAVVILSFLLAWLTYRIIEIPLRTWNNVRTKTATLCLLVGLIGYVGYSTANNGGLIFREVASGARGDDGGDAGNSLTECGIDDRAVKELFENCKRDKRGNVRFALLGDSKAAALYPGLIRSSSDGGRWMFIGGIGSRAAPLPLLSNDPEFAKFQPQISFAIQAIEENKNIDAVVIVVAIRAIFQISDGVKNRNLKKYDHTYLKNLSETSNYKRTLEAFSETILRLGKAKKKVIIVVDNPALPAPEDCAIRKTSFDFINSFLKKSSNANCFIKIDDFHEQISIYKKLLAELKSSYPDIISIFDPIEIYCAQSNGTCGPSHNGRPLYSYTDHISDYAAGMIGAKLNEFLIQNNP